MIDGINNGGPIRPQQGQRSSPLESADPARGLRRSAETPAVRLGHGGLVAELAASAPVDAARVADLKARIAAGTYTVDPQRIAAAMLALDRGRP